MAVSFLLAAFHTQGNGRPEEFNGSNRNGQSGCDRDDCVKFKNFDVTTTKAANRPAPTWIFLSEKVTDDYTIRVIGMRLMETERDACVIHVSIWTGQEMSQ